MKKLLVICGPTATGKTKVALNLAKKFSGELVSADSRQVYKGMNIGTGKDLPVNVKCQMSNVKIGREKLNFYEVNGVKIWGYDLVSPKEEFSVGKYLRIAEMAIKDIWIRERLPILVGGTGLYIKGVIDGIPTAAIPKNVCLREFLKEKTASELFEILANMDAIKAASMNTSDRKNPRRLVRAIEIASSKFPGLAKRSGAGKIQNSKLKADALIVGVTAPKELLYRNIEKRVEERLKKGIEEEIIKLLTSGVSWESQAMQSLGYKQWKEYFRKFGGKSGWKKGNTETLNGSENTERKNAIEKWKIAEKQYARRQITWFKKDKRMNWLDSSKKNFIKDVEKLVGKWYKTE